MKRRLVAATAGIILALVASAAPARADAAHDARAAEWHLAFLDIAKAQTASQGEGVTVAVIDTGINGNHPDLAGNVLPGVSLVPGHSGNGWEDIDYHGTRMAALIAAHGHDGAGILGIAPKCKILPIQVFSGPLKPDASGIIPDAINEAVRRGAKVISLSLGGISGSAPEEVAVEDALRADVVIVAAMGNTPEASRVWCPACHQGVVAVGGVDRNGNHAAISVTGPQMVVAAPATDIESTDINNGYGMSSGGTSDATAITAGVVALIRSKYPTMSAVDVIHRLTATAIDKGPKGRDDQYGYGIVNPYAALTADVPSVDPTASPSPTSAAPSPTAPPTGNGRKAGSIAVLAILVVLGVLATIWIRRAAARYRRRIRDD